MFHLISCLSDSSCDVRENLEIFFCMPVPSLISILLIGIRFFFPPPPNPNLKANTNPNPNPNLDPKQKLLN